MSYQRVFVSTILTGLIVVLAACGGAAPSSITQVSGLDTSYPNALNARGQLLIGTVRLEEGNGPAVSKEQAAKLIPLWQASKSLVVSGTASQAEIDAVNNQILAAMSAEQIKAIRAMQLVQADMQAFYQMLGVTVSSGMTPGQGQSLTPAERATRQAQMGGASSSTANVDYLIALLQKKASKN